MPLVRFRHEGRPTLGVLRHATTPEVTALPLSLAELLALPLADAQAAVEQATGPALPFTSADALPPVDEQEVWAAGVTYRRSRDGRIEESGNETLYDHVYASARPEIFFKASPARVVTDGQPVGIRADSSWDVPEAEIGLVINAAGEIVGYLAGNDMSSRSIEGENALVPAAGQGVRSFVRAQCADRPGVGGAATAAQRVGQHPPWGRNGVCRPDQQ